MISGRRVCIIRHRGYEAFVRREAQALLDAGCSVDVICLGERGHHRVEYDNGVRCIRLPLTRERGGTLRYLFDYGSFLVCASIVVTVLHLRSRYDVIQVNTMPDFLVFAAIVPRWTGAKVLAFMKEPSPELAEMQFGSVRIARVFAWIEQAVLRWVDASLTVTEQLRQRYVSRGADGSKIRVVLNGPDARYLSSSPQTRTADDGCFTLVCHGTIEDRYGHGTLIEAAAIARDQVPGLRVLITGSGSGDDRLRADIERLSLEGTVRYLGFLPHDELLQVLNEADVGVVPMRSNPYSNLVHTNKMFEYMRLAKPVIATRLDAVRAYFDDSAIAFVTPDDPAAMAAAIIDLHRNPGRRSVLASRALELNAEHGWEHQRTCYLDAVADLIGAKYPERAR